MQLCCIIPHYIEKHVNIFHFSPFKTETKYHPRHISCNKIYSNLNSKKKFDYLCNVNIQNEIVQIKFVFEINAHTPVKDTITTT